MWPRRVPAVLRRDQRFRIGSVTKTFTATIVLQLVQEGTLRLDSTLDEHLPGVVPKGGEITIRHLLGHRSGLANITDYPGWLNQAERSPSTSPINSLRFAASKPLAFEPGSQVRYSNTNYIALGLVIEKVTGRSYAEELEQRLLDPLGLSRTELPTTRRLPDLDDAGYNPNLPWAAGAIVSNAHDLSRFYSALLSGRILSAASLRAMKDTARIDGVFSSGLGIFSTDLACGRSWGHARLHPRLPDARHRERGGRPRRRRLAPRAWIHTVARESAALRGASPAGGLCASKVEDRVHEQHPPGSQPALRRERRRERAAVANAQRVDSSGLVWSPDGRRIAFENLRDGNSEIYVVNADGSGLRRLTRNPAHDFSSRLVARRAEDRLRPRPRPRRTHRPEVYVMNADGSGQRRLTRHAAGHDLCLVAGRAEDRLHERARRRLAVSTS